MQQFIVQASERGQRFDKYLRRRLPLAPSSFIYKMLRKKNITLRGRKAGGGETVEEGDIVALFLSDETIRKFSADADGEKEKRSIEEADRAYDVLSPLLGKRPVLYEDAHILLIAKPPGVLSQKAGPSDLSVNEWLRGFLRRRQKEREEGREEEELFTPSVCNRLDRNTGGILLCAKTLQGSRVLSEMIRERRIRKTYRMLVHGRITEPGRIEGDLIKDRDRNHVGLFDAGEMQNAPVTGPVQDPETAPPAPPAPGKAAPAAGQAVKVRHAVTVYRPVRTGRDTTLVEADLITGRSHQLRVHMASIGHPIVGDPRYGSRTLDRALLKKTGGRQIRSQLLWCTAVTFPETYHGKSGKAARAEAAAEKAARAEAAAGKTIRCPEPDWWKKLEE
ncbi:MAG: RluA family pseudouridine synthase [Eubacteriales bacterium]|nr:RluA family pseudouridine synthase [Lachnospiraceae bacterium]MDO4417224.1 RluA family pseudouridine synthase [Eubacteriales bacterium]